MSGWLDRALALLDADAIAETCAELVAIPSLGGSPEERACLDLAGAWLAGRGVGVDRWAVPTGDVPVPAGWSCELEREEVAGLSGTVGSRGPALLVNAHVDVVAAAEQPGWQGDPYAVRRDGRWLVGRGVADTKGGLAAAMHAAAALAAEESRGGGLPGRLVLSPVVGEEDGGLGTLASITAGLPDGAAALVVEPTDLRVARASAGALRFRVTVDGVAAHGSVRHRGVSAIAKGWLVHRALDELEDDRAARLAHPLVAADPGAATAWPVCVGRIEGGSHPCDVPDRLVLDGRLGVAPHEDPDSARAELEQAVARAAAADAWLAAHPPRVEWVGAQWLPAETPADHPLVRAFAGAAGSDPVAVPYGCDAGLLRHVAGIPAVIAGPGSVEAAHAPEERVAVEDLHRFAALLLRGAAAWWAQPGVPRA